MGYPENNQRIGEMIKGHLDFTNCLALKFQVEDIQGIKEKLPEYIESFKELAADLGPEAKELIDLLTFKVCEA